MDDKAIVGEDGSTYTAQVFHDGEWRVLEQGWMYGEDGWVSVYTPLLNKPVVVTAPVKDIVNIDGTVSTYFSWEPVERAVGYVVTESVNGKQPKTFSYTRSMKHVVNGVPEDSVVALTLVAYAVDGTQSPRVNLKLNTGRRLLKDKGSLVEMIVDPVKTGSFVKKTAKNDNAEKWGIYGNQVVQGRQESKKPKAVDNRPISGVAIYDIESAKEKFFANNKISGKNRTKIVVSNASVDMARIKEEGGTEVDITIKRERVDLYPVNVSGFNSKPPSVSKNKDVHVSLSVATSGIMAPYIIGGSSKVAEKLWEGRNALMMYRGDVADNVDVKPNPGDGQYIVAFHGGYSRHAGLGTPGYKNSNPFRLTFYLSWDIVSQTETSPNWVL